MSQSFYPTETFKLAGKTLIIPIVSTANVSQLTADLLIASLGLRRIGVFDPENIVPVVGAREDGEEGITTPLELFGKEDVDVVVVQQRSPALKSRKAEFTEMLLAFIKTSNFASVLFLAGVDLSHRTDAQMITPTYHIAPPNTPSLESTPLHNLLRLPIPAYTSPVSQHPGRPVAESDIPFISGGGLTRRVLSSLGESWTVPTAALLQFVLEGDNRADAHLFAAVVAKVLGIEESIKAWKRPSSWARGLFGSPPDQTLYG